jgi:hypothetical protein
MIGGHVVEGTLRELRSREQENHNDKQCLFHG